MLQMGILKFKQYVHWLMIALIKWQSWDLNPDILGPEPMVLKIFLCCLLQWRTLTQCIDWVDVRINR